ncbi:MAG: SUMF1/EgtB/PvdO family nonheme iron enzyme [Pirellulaceae bacterium]
MSIQKLNQNCLASVPSFCVGSYAVVVAFAIPRVEAQEQNVAAATFVVVSDARHHERGERKGQQAEQPVQGCFVFVPPSDTPNFNKYPRMRLWLDTHREQRNAETHRFRLEGGAISPATVVLRVGDSLDRWLNSESTLSLQMFSNPPIGPAPTINRNYTFTKSEPLPITISAAPQTDATAHTLVLDHDIGAASGEDGKVVISGLPTGIDIPMRISLPAAAERIEFRSDTLDIKRNGRFVLRLEGDTQFRIAISQGQDGPEAAQGEVSALPHCVRVSGAVQDANQLLLQPATLSIGLGPCSEACEITVKESLEVLKQHSTVKELELLGWPVATAECQELMRGVKSLPKIQAVHVKNRELETIENALGMKFVPIPMTLPGRRAERICIQQTEVTYEQYRKFKVAAGLATTQAEMTPSDQPLFPQDFDCWDDAARFIAQLNRWDTNYAYRMPTEDEWEFACTGRVGGPPVTRNVCEDRGNTNRWTRQSEPNQFGLHDILGVFGEYCSDLYNRNDDPSLPVIAQGKDARVVRGMRQLADKPPCFRYSSDFRFPVAAAGGQTPHLVIGVRLVLEPKK